MAMELLTHGANWSMVLEGVVDIFDVAAVHAAAVDAVVGAPEGVTVMLGGVTVIDTAVTQVLLALKAALAASGRTCVLDEVPPSVLETWTLAGLAPALDVTRPRSAGRAVGRCPGSLRLQQRLQQGGRALELGANQAHALFDKGRRARRRGRFALEVFLEGATEGRDLAGADRRGNANQGVRRAGQLRPLPARGGGLDRIGAARAVPHKCGEEVGQERGVSIGEGA